MRIVATVRSGRRCPTRSPRCGRTAILDRLYLTPFSKDQCVGLIEQALGGRVEGLSADLMWEASGGNALFVRHLVEGALEAGALRQVRGVWQLRERTAVTSELATLAYLTLIAVAILGVLGAIEGVRQVVVQRVGARLEVDVGQQLLAASLLAQGHDAASLLRDLGHARSFLSSPVFSALLDAPFAPLFLLIVFMIHPMLGGLVLLGIGVLLIVTLMNQWALSGPQQRSSDGTALAGHLVMAFTRNGEAMRAMGMSGSAIGIWGNVTANALNAQDGATRANAIFSGFSRFVRLVVQLGILRLSYIVLKQEITAGMIFATSLVSARALGPIDDLIAGWKGLLQTLISLRKINRALSDLKADGQKLPLPTCGATFIREGHLCAARRGGADHQGNFVAGEGGRSDLHRRSVRSRKIDHGQARIGSIEGITRHRSSRRLGLPELGFR